MIGLGTIINTAAIVLGGLAGLLFGNLLGENMHETLGKASGLGVMFIGISGTMEHMLSIKDGELASEKGLLVVVSLVLGAFFGELLKIENGFDRLGEKLRDRFSSAEDSSFLEGFLNTSLTVCVGAMVITGAIEDGMLGKISIYSTKAVLDLVTAMVMTCAYGKGCIFSAIPCCVIQLLFTFAAAWIGPYLSETALNCEGLHDSTIIFTVGTNLYFGKSVRTANLIPAIPVAVLLELLLEL